MIDTHCHLTDARLESQLEDVLTRAAAAGVSRLITIGTALVDDAKCIAVCKNRPQLRCAIGVHPNHVNDVEPADLPQLIELQRDASVVALGEMGLDYHYGKDSRTRQIDFFEFQLQLAANVRKPVVIHCREASEDCMAIIRNHPTVPAVFHCFTGTLQEAKKVLDAGYLLGFTGVVTFKNAAELREVVRLIPTHRMLVETDAPYLAPEPFRRQKVNEPALTMYTAAMVAQIKGMTLQEVDDATSQNASSFFGWP